MQMQAYVEEIINDFALFEDWEGRYAYLIDLGKKLPPMDDSLKTEATLVPGCTSQVWMVSEVKDGKLYFIADSDAHIVRGLIGILSKIYNERRVATLKEVDMKDVFQRIGLESHLSPNRRNGFFSMVERLHSAADDASSAS